MIEAYSLTKKFGSTVALADMSCKIHDGSIFGLVGSNGAGKSTFLRLVCGVLKPDRGEVRIDSTAVYENPSVKGRVFFVADSPWFLHQARMDDMADFYRRYYPRYSRQTYERLAGMFPLDRKKPINQMSKGQQRQVVLLLALACQPDYLMLDEAFDGLDPVMRQLFKRLLAESVSKHNQTVIISSHNLRELEDVCDHVGLLHKGGIVFEKELDALKLGIHKVQAAFRPALDPSDLKGLEILSHDQRGSLLNLVVRGHAEDILNKLENYNPLFAETLPLTLEEVFIHELEVAGYDVHHFIES